MARIDIAGLRARIQAMDFERGTAEQVALWREDDADARANLTIEGMMPGPDEDALLALMVEQAVPPSIATRIILDMLGPPVESNPIEANGA